MEEMWRDIEGYEGLYRISNYGNVYSVQKCKIMKLEIMRRGYLRAQLVKNGKRERIMVHRLVLNTFVGFRSYPEWEANHKDFNTRNNKLSNLEWVTSQENSNHKYINKPHLIEKFRKNMSVIGKKYNKLGIEASKKKVVMLDMDNRILCIYDSARDASKCGFNYKNISQVCKDEKATHMGYKWRFVQ